MGPSELNMAASIRLSRALSVISKFKYEQILLHPGSRQFLQKIQPSSYVLNNRCLSTSGFRNDQHNSEEIKTESLTEKREFQAETRMLLDIVAKSLYSEKEVFIRELISNASDALEKFRYMTLTGAELENNQRPLEINITTDKDGKSITIQDSGIGMSKEEVINNL